MAEQIVMPKQGNNVETVILLEWKLAEGDAVEEGDTLCEVETDKATFEVPSTTSGTLLRKLYSDGDDVPVLQAFAIVGEEGEDIQREPAEKADSNETVPHEAASSAPPQATTGKDSAWSPRQMSEQSTTERSNRDIELPGRGGVRISPLARRRAAQLGVDESSFRRISGSGPGGRILKADIEAFVEAGSGEPAQPPERPTKSEAEISETFPVTGTRKVIAERMLSSVTRTAQLTLNASVDATGLRTYRDKLKAAPESLGVSDITLSDILNFIVARVAVRHPKLNAHYIDGNPDEIRTFRGVNLGFAVDTDRGLYVPVIRGAHMMSLRDLADRAHELAAAVHAGRAREEMLNGATFTVTNLGAFGVRDFTPVLNPPQVAILGIGNIRPEQTYRDGAVVTAPHIGMSLTFDHRAVDGGPAARLLQDIGTAVAHAESVLAL